MINNMVWLRSHSFIQEGLEALPYQSLREVQGNRVDYIRQQMRRL